MVRAKTEFLIKVRGNPGGKGRIQCIVGDRDDMADLCEASM